MFKHAGSQRFLIVRWSQNVSSESFEGKHPYKQQSPKGCLLPVLHSPDWSTPTQGGDARNYVAEEFCHEKTLNLDSRWSVFSTDVFVSMYSWWNASKTNLHSGFEDFWVALKSHHGDCHKPQYWASWTMAISQARSISRPPGSPLQGSPTGELRGRCSSCQEPQVSWESKVKSVLQFCKQNVPIVSIFFFFFFCVSVTSLRNIFSPSLIIFYFLECLKIQLANELKLSAEVLPEMLFSAFKSVLTLFRVKCLQL